MVVIEARVVDGTHLELASALETLPGGRVLVCVSEPGDLDEERNSWRSVAAESLAGAYGESEPEYTLSMVKERNPEYEG